MILGGGKDLATAASISTLSAVKDEPTDIKIKDEGASILSALSSMPAKIPGGLVTKGNSSLGYEKVRVGGPGQTPFAFPSPGMFGNMGGLYPGMGGMAPMHGLSAAQLQLLQQSESSRCYRYWWHADDTELHLVAHSTSMLSWSFRLFRVILHLNVMYVLVIC